MRFRWIIYFVGFIALFGSSAFYYRNFELSKGLQAYQRQDYRDALQKLRPFSGWYDAQAETDLGVMYINGNGVPEDYTRARRLFEGAAASNLARAEFDLGLMYNNGEGVPINYGKAIWPEVMKPPNFPHKRTNVEHHAAWLSSAGAGLSGLNPSVFFVMLFSAPQM